METAIIEISARARLHDIPRRHEGSPLLFSVRPHGSARDAVSGEALKFRTYHPLSSLISTGAHKLAVDSCSAAPRSFIVARSFARVRASPGEKCFDATGFLKESKKGPRDHFSRHHDLGQ